MRSRKGRSLALLLAAVVLLVTAACSDDAADEDATGAVPASTTEPPAEATPSTTAPADASTTSTTAPPAAEQSVSTDPYAGLSLHAGYWVIEDAGPYNGYDGRDLSSISVHHTDLDTRRMTVYSQSTFPENIDGTGADVIVSPPQLDPGTCGPDPLNGQTVCAHANAVYLDGSGQEQDASNGEGTWWIKHSWILDGEGYRNCAAMPPPTELLDYDADCSPAIGTWQGDNLTMHVGFDNGTGEVTGIYNERRPLLDREPVAYLIDRIDQRPDAEAFTVEFSCLPDQASPLDGALLGCPAPNGETSEEESARQSGRGGQYCEVLLGYPSGDLLEAEIWGTQGLSQCDAEAFTALDPDAIQAEYDALFATMNGPRLGLQDAGFFEILEGPTRMYGEVEMHQVGVVTVDPATTAGGPYSENTVDRNNWFEWWEGTEVYELTNPAGERYRQISVAQYIEPLTLEDLPTLGDRLDLPEGWSWRTYVLEEDVRIEVNGLATVLQDELGNTYQKLVE